MDRVADFDFPLSSILSRDTGNVRHTYCRSCTEYSSGCSSSTTFIPAQRSIPTALRNPCTASLVTPNTSSHSYYQHHCHYPTQRQRTEYLCLLATLLSLHRCLSTLGTLLRCNLTEKSVQQCTATRYYHLSKIPNPHFPFYAHTFSMICTQFVLNFNSALRVLACHRSINTRVRDVQCVLKR